eukprot:gb/GECG01013582.1/.p1 GENE.gb/GECG01013582.1/~~gb/GECG01013582.1/.p1  ORF type:complete len:136 (+),score=0.90 gb/GECG01013582.1/:1-408(+)
MMSFFPSLLSDLARPRRLGDKGALAAGPGILIPLRKDSWGLSAINTYVVTKMIFARLFVVAQIPRFPTPEVAVSLHDASLHLDDASVAKASQTHGTVRADSLVGWSPLIHLEGFVLFLTTGDFFSAWHTNDCTEI